MNVAGWDAYDKMTKIEAGRSTALWSKLTRVSLGEFSWGGSLLLKCAVLGAGVCFIYWAGWPRPSLPPVSMPSIVQPRIPASHPTQSGPVDLTHEAAPVSSLRKKEVVQPLQTVAEKEISKTAEGTAFIVDLNDGTSVELEHLPGIGAVLAERIVAHRVSHGAFRRIEDLMLVPGIGEKRFQQLRPFVGVRASTSRMGS
ncbi:MAG: helix-hairpin-helix domain-containing protein [Nitrospirota bacterium]|nr:helix-hairpin-helix domain-containing protein [Nitrospirota bacterium]